MVFHAIVVRVPRYTSLILNSPGILTCDDWNGTIGGVVAVEVQGNTVINTGASIDATGKGFRGGSIVGDNVTSFGVNNVSTTDNTKGAEKGESVAGYQIDYDFGVEDMEEALLQTVVVELAHTMAAAAAAQMQHKTQIIGMDMESQILQVLIGI